MHVSNALFTASSKHEEIMEIVCDISGLHGAIYRHELMRPGRWNEKSG